MTYQTDNEKDRNQITKLLLKFETATRKLAAADLQLGLCEGDRKGLTHKSALDAYTAAQEALSDASVIVHNLRERSRELAAHGHTAEIVPISKAVAEKHEQDGGQLIPFLAKEQEGDR